MKRISDEQIERLIIWASEWEDEYRCRGDNINAEIYSAIGMALRELQQRRGQTCATCDLYALFSDDPVFSADEDLWCAELERYKPRAGYCDQWIQAKEAK